MADNICPQCGAPNELQAHTCKYCGESLKPAAQQTYQQPPVYTQPPVYQQPVYQQPFMNNGIDMSWPIKSKVAAGLLAIFLGGIGIHKFYLGKVGAGVVYLIFSWTFIPAFIGFIEGIVYLCSNDHNFQVKNHVRLQ